MKNKLIGLTAVMMTIVLIAPVMAQTTVDTYWKGSGDFETHFIAGDDAHSDFWTSGYYIKGEHHAIDHDDNPYGYDVDTVEEWVEAEVSGGGYIEFLNQRTDSWSSMYGPAGQRSYSYIGTDDKGEIAFHTWTNYASLKDCQYGWGRTSKGHHFEATGGNFTIYHELRNGNDGVTNPDGASIGIYGSGSAWIDFPRGNYRVTKGGSWRDPYLPQRTYSRYYDVPTYDWDESGFRCASD